MQQDPDHSEGPTQAIQPSNNNVNNNNTNVTYLTEEDLLNDNVSINLDVESDSDFQPDQSLLGNAFNNDGDVPDTTTGGRVKRGATVAYAAYTLFVISFFTAALIKDSGKECDKPLHTYATIEIITQAIAFVLYICVHHFNGCDPVQVNQDVIIARFSFGRWIQFMRRVLNMFWMFWLVMASFWTFSADTCDVTSPLLYTFSLVIVLIHLVFFGLVLVCCWCALLVIAVIYRLHPEIFTQPNNSVAGASDKAINALETKKYTVGMMDAEDAKCAICLAAYEPGEDIRFLPCDSKKHHFHNQCIDEWLRISGSCPYCKHGIEEKDKKNNNNNEESANNGNTDDNV
eukprot:TRINITY_DN1505_c0_g3_i1.p1 TRINITY_DN1505_c0_g3~~TRINITY_DN1505_c0_g3_i1.p1  ORF type:complete len:344 (-),score=23.39 TRINITY_DN1505_c0_g3_i1:38-1069(-)